MAEAEQKDPRVVALQSTQQGQIAIEVVQSFLKGHNLLELAERVAAEIDAERRRARHQFWYSMKSALGPGIAQQQLNAVADSVKDKDTQGW